MRIILTKAIATDHLGAIPVGTGMDVSASYGDLLITRGFARSEEGDSCDGIVRWFDEDTGSSWFAVAEDSGGCADGADGPAE